MSMKENNNSTHTSMRSRLAEIQSKKQQMASKASKVRPAKISVNLSSQALPPDTREPIFRFSSGWENDAAGLDRTVEAMIEQDALPPVKTVFRLGGSVPNRVEKHPKVATGRPVGGLPELMAKVLALDEAMPSHAKGTALVSSVSLDDQRLLTRGLFGDQLSEEEQIAFDEAVAAAYHAAPSLEGARPDVVVYDERRLPVWITLSPTASIVLTTTGIAGGGKDTSAMARRQVTGAGSTTAELLSLGWSMLETVRAAWNGIEVGLVASHGGTSKDVLTAHLDTLDASAAPVNGGHQFLLSTPFSAFAKAERADVGLEMMSTIGLVGFGPRPSPPEGGWHVTFVEEDHGSMQSLDLMMLEHALTEHAELASTNKDRTDRRNAILSWGRDLGRGCGHTGTLGKDGQPLEQVPDFWLLSGERVTLERLTSASMGSRLEEGLVTQLRQLFSRALSTTSVGSTTEFRPDVIHHARRCIKAATVKIYLPQGHGFTGRQLERIRIQTMEAAVASFDITASKYAVPTLDVAVFELPNAGLSSPHMSVHCLTHARDLLRTILVDITEMMDEVTPHGLLKIGEDRMNHSQLARRRVDAMIAALQKQEQTNSMAAWANFWSRARKSLFTMEGWTPKVDRTAFDAPTKVDLERV